MSSENGQSLKQKLIEHALKTIVATVTAAVTLWLIALTWGQFDEDIRCWILRWFDVVC